MYYIVNINKKNFTKSTTSEKSKLIQIYCHKFYKKTVVKF